MGCGRSKIETTPAEKAREAAEKEERAREAAAKAITEGAEAAEVERLRVEAEATSAAAAAAASAAAAATDSSHYRAIITRNALLDSLPKTPPADAPLETLIFGDSIRPSRAFPITIYYQNQLVPDETPSTGSKIATLYSMPDELLIRYNIILFRYNATINDGIIFRSACYTDLYESDIDSTNSDIYTLVEEGKARRVPSQRILIGYVQTFYNITLNSGKYYQVIISSRGSPDYPKERQIVYYQSSVKRYMGVDAFTNKRNYSSIEGYMENHPLLPKEYYNFKL